LLPLIVGSGCSNDEETQQKKNVNPGADAAVGSDAQGPSAGGGGIAKPKPPDNPAKVPPKPSKFPAELDFSLTDQNPSSKTKQKMRSMAQAQKIVVMFFVAYT
jgi:hypothetical protein